MATPAPLPAIQALAPYTPGLSIAEIAARYDLPQVIKLASNENPLGCSPLATEAISRCAASAFRYPQGGNPRLAAALARKYHAPADRIAIGNGSDEIIDLLIRILAQPGEHNLVCFEPCFSIYPIQAQINGVACKRQPLEPDFSFDFQKLLALVDTDTRLVFITTPDNPSGYLPPLASVRQLADDLARKAPRALLVIDEAYMDFAPDEAASSLLRQGRLPANTAILRTFSKSYGLAGLRIGFAVLPERIAAAYWAARLPFSLNLLAEEAALAALDDACFHALTLKTVTAGRQILREALESMGCAVYPSAANFLMFSLPAGHAASACFEHLLRKGVIIRPLKSYGLPHLLRVSVGNKAENKAFIAAMADFLA